MNLNSLFLLSIGDELLDGRTQNTNASFFGEQLRLAGISVSEIRCVSDRVENIVHALKDAQKFSLVIATGGLGPTNDDRTMEAAAKYFRKKLMSTKASLAHVISRYKKRKLPLTPERLRLSLIPQEAKILQNPLGTAPGVHYKQGKTDFFFLPGVPSECRHMFLKNILPIAQKKITKKKLLVRKFWRCFGKGESQIYQVIAPVIKTLEEKYPDTFVFGIHITFPCIDLTMESWKVAGKASPSAAEIKNASLKMEKAVRDICFTRERESLVDVVSRLLHKKSLTLSTAESCTGGLLGKMLTDLPGSSDIFLGGIVSYANKAKRDLLGVRSTTLKNYGAVSEETAKEMAEGARSILKSNYALALSGISGPSGGSAEKPVGTICIAIAGPNGTKSLRQVILNSAGSRDQNRVIATYLALDALRIEIISH